MSGSQILGLGTIVVDHQFMIETFPVPDTKIETTQARWQIGGPVPTALVLLSRWGHTCQFAGFWGNDPLGDMIEDDLRNEKVIPLDGSRGTERKTGIAHVWVEEQTGRRTIVCHRTEPEVTAGQEWKESLPEVDLLHLDGWPPELAIELAKQVHSRGGLVSLDTGSPKGQTGELLKFVDVVNAPRRFLKQFLGHDDPERGGRQLLDFGPRFVTVTDGSYGAWLFADEQVYHQPAFPVDTVDTTGAGDVFTGALIHGVLQDWPSPQILAFASASAALKCTRLGNRDALPTFQDVSDFLSSRSSKTT